jgi:hypothetical protein
MGAFYYGLIPNSGDTIPNSLVSAQAFGALLYGLSSFPRYPESLRFPVGACFCCTF